MKKDNFLFLYSEKLTRRQPVFIVTVETETEWEKILSEVVAMYD